MICPSDIILTRHIVSYCVVIVWYVFYLELSEYVIRYAFQIILSVFHPYSFCCDCYHPSNDTSSFFIWISLHLYNFFSFFHFFFSFHPLLFPCRNFIIHDIIYLYFFHFLHFFFFSHTIFYFILVDMSSVLYHTPS